MSNNKYFTIDEILGEIKSAKEYNSDYFDDLFNSMFNNDDYIYYYNEASEALNSYTYNKYDYCEPSLNGVFGAIELVQTYEKDNFDEVNTDISNPCELANMAEYIRAESVFNAVLDRAGLTLDDETNSVNLNKFIKSAETI